MPCLLVKDGRLVKTVRFKKPAYIGDPINAIKIYNDKEVDELIVLDISASVERRGPSFELIEEVAGECFMPFAYGGGVRDIDDMRTIFSLGVEKVAINSHAGENPELVRQAADIFGSQSIIASIDVKKNMFGKYGVYAYSGSKALKIDPAGYARKMEDSGAGELLLNAIDQDGMMDGFDIPLIRQVAQAVTIPVIAVGGAGKTEDLAAAVKEGGASAVAAGSLFVYQGKNRGVLINFPRRSELERLLN